MSENIIEIPAPSLLCHLAPHYRPAFPIVYHYNESLPYIEIGWSGLERLCYLLLLQEGTVPRFFGNKGQEQYGIDLLVIDGNDCTVYQCKNVKSFTPNDVKHTLELFAREWLGRTDLPKPNAFVLCCSVFLRETEQNKKWTILADKFHKKTGVEVIYWHRDYLDERLKHLPDIVADLFSDKIAEWFCEMKDWNSDLFRPLVLGSGERIIERYLKLKEDRLIYIDPRCAEDFIEKIESNGSLLIKGLPGVGKTITALALAELFQEHRFRIFYVNLSYDIREDDLVTGIKRRLTRPTIFLLDNCHGKYEMLDNVQVRLAPNLIHMHDRFYFVFLSRTVPTQKEIPRGDYSTFENSMQQANAVLNFKTTIQLFKQIIVLGKPNFVGLSKKRLEKAFHFCGGDLFLLDQLVGALDSPSEIDVLRPDRLFEQVLIRYFGAPTVNRPGFISLAAFAQFEIAPPVTCFDVKLEEEDLKAASQLVIIADRPPRYFFLHSSAAELIYRALAWNNKVEDYMGLSVDYLIEFFKRQPKNEPRLIENLSNMIGNHLKLTTIEEENALKSSFLANKDIFSLIDSNFNQIRLNIIVICLIILEQTDAEAVERYVELVEQKIMDHTILNRLLGDSVEEFGLFLHRLKVNHPNAFSNLQNQFHTRMLLYRLQGIEIQNYLLLLAFLSEPSQHWHTLVESFSDQDMDLLIKGYIASGCSIGSLNISLRELKDTDEALLDKLEQKIGASRYMNLISQTGTIMELFGVIRYSTLTMAEEIIDTLDDATLDILLTKTIDSGRTIGTLHMALRELKDTDETLLQKLEQKIGASRYMNLISQAGTIIELFRVISYSTLTMAKEIIDKLDDATLDILIAKTISSGRSIGTLHLSLRELKDTDEALLQKLEQKIGAEHYLDLVSQAGTIFELFRVIQYSTLTMAEEIIDKLDDATLDILIAKTISSGRSIGTLHLSLRELKDTDEALLQKLEQKIGAEHYLDLVSQAGTIFELFRVIQYSTLTMAEEIIDKLDDAALDILIAKTISSGRSIGTLSLALRELKKGNQILLGKLERKVDVQRWWRLIQENGTLRILGQIMQYMSTSFRKVMTQAASPDLSVSQWHELLLRGDFEDLAYFIQCSSRYFSRQLNKDFLDRLRPASETLVQNESWKSLNRGMGLITKAIASPIRDSVICIVLNFLANVQPHMLHCSSFSEAANCICLLLRETPSKRSEVISSIHDILPQEDVWHEDEEFLRSARSLFSCLASHEVRLEDVHRVLKFSNAENVAVLFEEATTLDIFLYLWNLYSLWFEWERKGDRTFSAFLHPDIQAAAKEVLIKRLQTKNDQDEADNLIALMGLLSFLGMAIPCSVKHIKWLSKPRSIFVDLLLKVVDKTFVPGVFFLLGLEDLFNKRGQLPKQRWLSLLDTASEYTMQLASVEDLHNLVCARAGIVH